jgi:hypothetical protein
MRRLDIALLGTHARGRHQPERADHATRLIRQNVALHVLEQHHAVELTRTDNQLKRCIVDQHRAIRHIWILLRDILDHRIPEAPRREHVGLVHVRHLRLTLARFFECDARHAPNLFVGVAAVVLRKTHARAGAFGLLPEVDAAHQLADHQDVDAVADHRRLEW